MFRKKGRTPISCHVQFNHGRMGHISAVTRDVSATGMFICLESEQLLRELAVGDFVEAVVDSTHNPSEILHMQIARLTEDGAGMHFS